MLEKKELFIYNIHMDKLEHSLPNSLTEKQDFSLHYTSSRQNPELSVYESGWQKCKFDFHYGPDKRVYYILHYVVCGEGILYVNKKKYTIHKNDLFLLPPNIETEYLAQPENPWQYYWVGFNGITAQKILKLCGFIDDVYVLSNNNSAEIIELLKKISSQKKNDPATEYLLLGYLYQLFAILIRNNSQQTKPVETDDYIRKAIRYINEKYNTNINVGNVATYVGLERSYFFKLFKKNMGISPQKYIINVKLNKALELLKSSNFSLNEICYICGFNDYPHFCKYFKKTYFIPPKEYRKKPFDK